MINIKSYKNFESVSDFDIELSDIELYFVDFEDDGFVVRCRKLNVLKDMNVNKSQNPRKFNMGLINYISVILTKNDQWSISNARNQRNMYREIHNSDKFKEDIEVIKNRLSDNGLFIDKIIPYGSRIEILIYKETDKKYL